VPRVSVRTRQLAAVAAVFLLVLPAVALAKLTLTAPDQARAGQTIHVVAHGLMRARNAVTLQLDHTAARRVACIVRLGRAASASTTLDLRVKIPTALTCWTNGVVRGGTIAVRPGAYHLVVAKPTGPATFSGPVVRRALKIVR
jgi:hypothetical protein